MTDSRTSTTALRNPNYLVYISGSAVALHGLWIYRVALGWYAWELTGSELWVGIVAFTQFAPAVIFGPLFGVFADRFNRRKASILINTGTVTNMLVLCSLTLAGHVDIAMLATSSFLQGTLDGAHAPVRMSLVPSIVHRGQMQSAIATNSIVFNLSRFVGPALSGFIIANFGVGYAFGANGIAYLGIIVAIFFVKVNPRTRHQTQAGDVWSELLDGVRYVIGHQTIRALLITVAVGSVFGRGALEMLPAFADLVFDGGASALAAMTSALGAGAVATGVVLARHSNWLSARVVRICVAIAGVTIIAFSTVSDLGMALPLVVVLGIVLSLAGVGSQILIQTLVDDEVRGRVSSLWGMIAFGGTALGGLIVGTSATVFGLQPTVMVTGILCALVALLAKA